MRPLNKELNIDKLRDDTLFEGVDNGELNKILNATNKVVKVLADNDIGIEESYILLTALADAIYVNALYGFEDEIGE